MKKICSCLMILPFFISCDNDEKSVVNNDVKNASVLANRPGGITPGNADNIYDFSGELYNELVDSYGPRSSWPSTLTGTISHVETLANANTGIAVLKTADYAPITTVRAQYLLTNGTTCLDEVITASGLASRPAKDFKAFINLLLPLCSGEANYLSIYDFITEYESEIIDDGSITEHDRKLILVTTSIVRYSAFYRRKPKKNTDIDWEFMVTHIIATIEGASDGSAEAITTSVSVSIAENQ